VERQWSRWQERLRAAEGGAGAVVRRIEAFLRRFEAPEEAMLRALRHVAEVVLVHPSALDGEQARQVWRAELRRQAGNQLFWLVVHSVIGPVTAVGLAILPGPNLIGYWFLYRAAAHGVAWSGVRRALNGQIRLETRAEPLLDEPLRKRRRLDWEVVERLERGCGLTRLRAALERSGWVGDQADRTETSQEAPEPPSPGRV
jgi:hypothetical protein